MTGLSQKRLHLVSRLDQPDRHHRRSDRVVRMAEVRSIAHSNRDLSCHDDPDQRDGLYVPIHQVAAVAYRRHQSRWCCWQSQHLRFTAGIFQGFGVDLYRHRHAGVVPERVRLDRSVVLEVPLLKHGRQHRPSPHSWWRRERLPALPRFDGTDHRKIPASPTCCPLTRVRMGLRFA